MRKLKYSIQTHELRFLQPATTSRGVYRSRLLWLVCLQDPDDPSRYGIGEAAPLPDLSPEICTSTRAEYEQRLHRAVEDTASAGTFDRTTYIDSPSICFAIESALAMFNTQVDLYASPFAKGQVGIRINGLVWMGSVEQMMKELEKKVENGFRCIKCKIGAIDFEREIQWLRRVRKRFAPEEIELRVDANGAFTPQEAMNKLVALSTLGIHSIEQPISPGQWVEMSELIRKSPIPIALDEDLIGHNSEVAQAELLQALKPHYIVLKPSLHGGLKGVCSWVNQARMLRIDSWITSALESNVGLEMIARLAASLYGIEAATDTHMPQGLGTGRLYEANFPSPLHLEGDMMWLQADRSSIRID